MKTLSLLFIITILTLFAKAQNLGVPQKNPDSIIVEKNDTLPKTITDNNTENQKSDTTRIRVGKKSISIIEDGADTYYKVMDSKDDKEKKFDFEIEDDEMHLKKKKSKNKFEGHFAGFELGLNNYGVNMYNTKINKGDEFMELNSSKSVNCNLNLLQYSIPLFSNNFGIVTGLGIEFNHYSFDNNNTLQKDSSGFIVPKYFSPGVSLEYSKLATTYLNCPLIIELQIPTSEKKNKPIHLGAGVIGGLKIGSKTKYKVSGNSEKSKLPGNYNLSPFQYGLTFRVGYRALNLYSNVYLTPLFEKKGPVLYPFNIGLTIIPFD